MMMYVLNPRGSLKGTLFVKYLSHLNELYWKIKFFIYLFYLFIIYFKLTNLQNSCINYTIKNSQKAN